MTPSARGKGEKQRERGFWTWGQEAGPRETMRVGESGPFHGSLHYGGSRAGTKFTPADSPLSVNLYTVDLCPVRSSLGKQQGHCPLTSQQAW